MTPVAHRPRVVFSVGAVALLTSLAVPARAATTTYDTNNTPYTGGLIIPGDTVLLNDGADVTGNITVDGTLQFNQSAGNTLTISNVISGTGTLSLTNTGTLNLTGVSEVENIVRLDMTTSASLGVLQINSASGDLWVGGNGTGTLNVTGGYVSNAKGILGGDAGSIGTATVSSGTWASSGDLLVGAGSTGTLNVTGGYVSNANGYLGYHADSVGTATVSSGTWANGADLYVGYSGTGTLTMTGGLVSVAGILSRGSFGTINLNSGGTLQIGVGGNTGGLNVSTLTNNGTLIFNRSDNSTYSGIISGTGAVTKQGAGTLTLYGVNSYSGGTTISTGGVTVAAGGAISHASADVYVGRTFGESGTLNVNGGSVTNSIGYLGYDAGSNGTATVSKGTWANSADLYVGVGGTGTLNVTGGEEEEDEDGYVSNTTGYLGYDAGSNGTATVSSGTWANSADLYVGVGGTGTLTMTGGLVTVGGTLSQGSFGTINLDSGGTLQIGVGGNTGVLNVSTLTNNGTLIFNRSDDSTYSGIISGAGAVTKQGVGTLTLGGVNSYSGGTTISAGGVTVAAGGAISHASAGLVIGRTFGESGTLSVNGGYVSDANGILGVDAGSVGTATVSSGTWANSGVLTVGSSGTGTLNVSGGNVSNTFGFLGYAVGSNGTATVSSGTWANSADLTVGRLGRGTLNVTGGRVSNNAANLGAEPNTVGTVNVSSGTWANRSNIDVGSGGTGTLNVNGGYVSSTGNSHIGLNAGSSGTATVSSGTWANTGQLRVGNSGNGTLNVSGGSVNVTGAGLLGRQTSGVGTANVSSGTWAMSGNFTVGDSGRGTLNVTGGLVSSNNSTLGSFANSVGTANVSSGTWATLGSSLTVGSRGNGTLNVTGGRVSNNSATLGANANSVGTANVSSGTWVSGNLTVGSSGTGTLNLTGGLVAVAGELSKGIYGTINLNSGGTLQIGVGDTTGVLGVSTFTNNGTLIFNQSNASTYSGSVSGTGAVTKLGLGTLTLSGSNAYTGATNINGGALALGNASALAGGGTISFGGGSLQYSASNTVDYATRILNSGSAISIDTNGQDVTFATGLGSSNTGGLTKLGLGTLTLSASNDYTGVTSINGGVLALGNASAFAGGGTISFGGGSLQYSASNTVDYSATILNSGSAISIDTNGQNITFASGLGSSNTGGLTKSGLGTLTLSASNGYTGGTTISGGQLTLANANALAAANAMTITSGTLDLHGQSSTLGSLYGSSGGTITTGTTGLITLTSSAAASSTYAGSISNGAGTIAFTKSGLGTLTLSGSNSYTGVTTINGGALALGNASALAGGGTISFGGGSLQYSASNTLDYSTRILNSGSTISIDTNGQNVTFASNLGSSNTGGLTKLGLGTLTLSAGNDYTGATTINGGVLALNNASAFAGGGTISFGGGSLQYSASNTVDYSTRILNSGSAISIDTNGQDITFASGLGSSNTGGLAKSGLGTLTLSASNGYTGGTTISGGQLTLANANALSATGAMTITSGTLDLNGQSRTLGLLNGSSGGTITTGTAGLITLTSSATASSTYAGSINNGAGTIAFTKQGAGTLTLSGSNDYTGATNINGGVLALGNASGFAGGGTISFGGGSLQYSASNTVDYSTRILNSGSAISIDTNGQDVTFASNLGSSNTGGLTKLGLGTLTLSASNDYTGRTNINGGVLALGSASAFAGGGTISFGGGSLQYSASNTVDYSTRILNSGSAISIDTNGQDVTFASNLGSSNTGGLTKSGLGTLTLSAGNDYTGATAVNGGVLALGNASALAGTGTISFGGGSLQYSASNTVDYSTRILNSGSAISIDTNGQNITFASGLGSSNTGGLTKSGDGTLTLSASNGYTGGTTISGGQLTLANANALAATNAMTITSGTLDLNGQSRTVGLLNGSSGGTITTGTTGLITLTSSAAASSTYAGSIIDGAGTIAFTKQGAGTLTLSGSNDYTGETNINRGVLALGNASALAGGGTISFGGGSLQYSASNTVDYSARILNSGSAISIDTNGQNITFASNLGSSNTGGLTKLGLGTLTLSASNDYTGATNINGGVLALGNASALAGGGTISFGGGSLEYSASNTVDYSTRILNSGSAIWIDTNGQDVTFASNLGSSNTGGLTKSGDGMIKQPLFCKSRYEQAGHLAFMFR